jgi:mannose-6-phosphate isomerase
MERLANPVRHYAWGSHTAIARIQGRSAPTGQPEAELWLGAHPDAPSALRRDGGEVPLTEVIAADPAGTLGPAVASRYDARLPFLLKVLAAAEPLSLQAHPDQEQAAAGYDAEERAGIPRDAPQRSYRDRFHKPELLVAVEPFEALCGFRHPHRAAADLAALGVPGLSSTVDVLAGSDRGAALRDAVTGLIGLPTGAREELVSAVVQAARERGADPPSGSDRILTGAEGGDRAGPDGDRPAPLAVRLGQRYPGDIGVVVALLLNQVRLEPGEAVWMPAGNLHAYLHGTGVETMAASDNVLRGGLTPKHVDVPELLRVLRFEVLDDPVVPPREIGPGLVTWAAPVDEFVVHRAVLGDGGPQALELPGAGVRIVLCLDGQLRVDDGVAPLTLTGGQAGFAPAGRRVRLSGRGTAFQAATP